MDPTVKALWTAALRSGEYQPIDDALHKQWPTPNMFSVWGVLCDLHRLATGGDIWRGPDGRGGYAYLGHFGGVPRVVWEWAGLPPQLPIRIEGMGFGEAVNAIEAHL